MELARAYEIVLELALQNIADQLDHPSFYAEQSEAVDLVANHVGKMQQDWPI